MSADREIKFRAYLLILNSEFPTHRKTEAMEELLKIYKKQQEEIEKKDKIINEMAGNIFLMNGDRGCTKKEIIDYFTKKVEE